MMPSVSHLTLAQFLCGICLLPFCTKGLTLTSQGSAVLGEGFRYICNISDGVDPNTILTFDRGSEAFSATVCTVQSWGCFHNSTDPRYSCGCLPGHTLFFMKISHVNLQDDDDWTCQYKGVRSKISHLNVYYSPSITSKPTSKDVAEYTSPNIDCSSNITPGNPSSISGYRWTGPGGYIKTGAVLDRNMTRTHGGHYTCTATNTAGLSDTTTVNINVQYAPKIALVAIRRHVTECFRLSIDCSSNITSGNPSSIRYKWTGPDGYSKTGAVLDRNFTRTQAGQYTCTANNAAGLSDTARLNIDVYYPPKITSVPRTKGVIENTSPDIDCSSNITPGNPSSMSSYRWTGPGGYNTITAKLSKMITRYQEGHYICIGTNTAGLSDTAEVNITVFSSPFAPAMFKAYRISETRVKLTWISQYDGGADQVFQIKYQENGSDVKNQLDREIDDPGKDKMVSWNISKLEPDTLYIITLTSGNIYGTSSPVWLNITTSTTSKALSDSQESNGIHPNGIGVGISIGVGVSILLVAVIVWIKHKMKKDNRETDSHQQQRAASSERNRFSSDGCTQETIAGSFSNEEPLYGIDFYNL